MNLMITVCAAALVIPTVGFAYERAFESTRPGETEIKTIPARTVIVARRGENYFEENNALFGKLFRYIQTHDVSMTVPVKADIEPGSMYFYVGSEDVKKDLKDSAEVKVVAEPEVQVLSMGVRGGYSEKNFQRARADVLEQLALLSDWQIAGDAYAVFWNGPYVPAFMKKFEVHVPVTPSIAATE